MPDPQDVVRKWLQGQADAVSAARSFGRSFGGLDLLATGLAGDRWLRTDGYVSGATGVRQMLDRYSQNFDPREFHADRRLFDRKADPSVVDPALRTLWTVVATAMGPRFDKGDVAAGLRIAFGGDTASQVFRALLTGDPLPGDPGLEDVPLPFPEIPNRNRIDLSRLERIKCFGGLGRALNGLAQAASGIGRTVAYPGMTIADIVPRRACAGDVVTIRGAGFGATQPADAVIVFGTIRADVVPGSWSDTAIQVRVPANASECCIGILRVPQATVTGETLASAVSTLAGVVSECFGKAGIAFAGRLEQLANRIPDSEQASCNPDGSNRFIGGQPRIGTFRTNLGVSSPQRLTPGRAIEIEWAIANAQSATLTITASPTNSPLARTPTLPSWFSADPEAGRVTLPPAGGLVPWQVDVTLDARNPCGTATGTIRLQYSPAAGFVFVGGGMRSAFHLGASEALGLLITDPPVVCSGSGLGALSAYVVAAEHPNPASLRTFWQSTNDDTAWFTTPPALVGAPDVAAIGNARWQADARAEVLALGALDVLRPFIVPYKPGDDRYLEKLITMAAGVAADKAMDALSAAVGTALEEAGQTALSYVPIVAIIWAAAKWGLATFQDSLKQQTATLLASVPAMLDPTPLRGLIATALTGADARIAVAGRRVRVPLTSLERGMALYGMEGGAVSKAPVMSEIVANTTTTAIVNASASVPLIGPPVTTGSDTLLDGSLRDPVPIGATVEAGAGTVIVVQPNNRMISERTSFAAAGFPAIDARTSLMRDAQFLDGAVDVFGAFSRDPVTLEPVGRWRAPVFVVEPSVNILGLGAAHGEIGLTHIMSDYGYMRAYDVLAPWLLFPDESQRAHRERMAATLGASSDAIVGLRVAAWELEHYLNGMRATPFGPTNRIGGGPLVAVPDDNAIGPIRDRKTDIRAALVARLAIPGQFEPLARPGATPVPIPVLPVPRPAAQSWYLDWEQHSYAWVVAPSPPTPAMPNGDPWVSLTYGGTWTVAAAARPANLWP